MGPDIFHVLTEFRFEVSQAITSSKLVQDAVGGISDAAEHALGSFERLSMGIVAQMGLGSGGVLGVMYEAIQASEKFGATQRKIANIFMSNQGKIAGGPKTFLETMSASSTIMDEILLKARQFAIPATPLANMTALLGAPLFGAGAGGKNLSTAIDIARGVLKSAPVLGVDPNQAGTEVVSMVLGRGNIQDQFVNRIINDTDAFRNLGMGSKGHGHGGGHAGGALAPFNALSIDKRVKVLTEALLQFASSTEIVDANAKSLTNQLQVLRDTMSGLFSILAPIGKVFSSILAPALYKFNLLLQTDGQKIADSLARLLGSIFQDPEKILGNLLQLKNLKKDTHFATVATEIYATILGLFHVLKFFNFSLRDIAVVAFKHLQDIRKPLGRFFAMLTEGVYLITGVQTGFGLLWWIMNGLTVLLSRILVPFTLLLGLFQLISRAQGIAHIEDAKRMVTLAPALAEAFTKLKIVTDLLLAPFYALFDGIARGLAPFFQFTGFLSLFVTILETLTTVIILVQAGFQGLIFGLMETYNQFISARSGQGFSFDKIKESFTAGIDDMIEKNMTAIQGGSGPVANHITNINGDININNAFKEQMEPDRIAFTLVDQLRRVAQNPLSAPGRSLGGALVR